MELLAPAGNHQIAKSVLNAGADAVYLGGRLYNARMYAGNLSGEEICDILDYAHIFGRKIFLTLNTLHLEKEMGEELLDYIGPFCEHGLDGVIVQDLGIIRFIQRNFPKLPIHGSTQMTVASKYGAAGLYDIGLTRVVLPRELSLSEIKAIHDHTPIELEVFIHGALCYCYSGQCLMSSFLGGRSGNRGACAQPCRLPYSVCDENGTSIASKGPYILSLKDNNAAPLLRELRDAGVTSLKIEGRMKQEAYAVGVVRVYRELLDELEEADTDSRSYVNQQKQAAKALRDLGSRSGFTDAYLRGQKGPGMVTFASPSHEKKDMPYERPADMKLKVRGRVVLHVDEPAVFELSCGGMAVHISGQIVQKSQKRATEKAEILAKTGAFGNTVFEAEDILVEADPDIFYPASGLKELRRRACEEMIQKLKQSQV